MMTDRIADFLTRIRNAVSLQRSYVKVLDSSIIRNLAIVMKKCNYIESYDVECFSKNFTLLKINLKYDIFGKSVIGGLKRISKPGLRVYTEAKKLPTASDLIGIALISTSFGILTSQEAKKKNVGGEVICYVW